MILVALASLREIDDNYVARHPYTFEDELQRRMKNLRRTVTAISELEDRGEPADPDTIRAEMLRLGDDFTTEVAVLAEIAAGFREYGDLVNAITLENAIKWHRQTMLGSEAA